MRSIMLGVLIGLFIGPFTIYVTASARMILGDQAVLTPSPLLPPFGPPAGASEAAIVVWLLVFALIAAPLFESLVFPPLHWILRRLPGGNFLFVATVGVAAYVWHGMSVANLGQAAGFMLMAQWYSHLSERFPSPSFLSLIKTPYFGVVLAHVGWNATIVLWPLALGSLIHLTSR